MKPILAAISFFSALTLAAPALAQGSGCGLYELTASVRRAGDGFELATAPGSNSETVFSVSAAEGSKLLSFEGATVKCRVRLAEPPRNQRAKVQTIESLERTIADPLELEIPAYRVLRPGKCPSRAGD